MPPKMKAGAQWLRDSLRFLVASLNLSLYIQSECPPTSGLGFITVDERVPSKVWLYEPRRKRKIASKSTSLMARYCNLVGHCCVQEEQQRTMLVRQQMEPKMLQKVWENQMQVHVLTFPVSVRSHHSNLYTIKIGTIPTLRTIVGYWLCQLCLVTFNQPLLLTIIVVNSPLQTLIC